MRTRLSDGTPVLLRSIEASDKQALAAGLTSLSAESVRRRFLTAKPRFTAAELRYLTEVDGFDHYAVVAIDPRHPGGVIAVARLVRLNDDPGVAEAAIIVCDAYQGRRLGTRLAVLLADAARERGINRIQASMESDNVPALALMRTIAARLTSTAPSRGVREVVADIAVAG